MRRRSWLIGFAPIFVAAGASASSLGGSSSAGLAAGASAIARCDGDGFTTSYQLSGGLITAVDVKDVAAACAGGDVYVTVTDSGGAALGSGGPTVVPGGGGTVSVSISANPAAIDAVTDHVVVIGP